MHPFRYVVSLGLVGLALLLRGVLDPLLGSELVFAPMFGAVAVAVWYGGVGAGILAAAVGYVAANILFLPPRGSFAIANLTEVIRLGLYVGSAALIIGVGESLRRGRRATERANEELERQRELFRVSLTSIGDGVIATDRDGRVTLLNAVAQSLTGWTEDEARGRPLEEVFRILQEQTRKPVENPALRALKEGQPVALVNHTILIDARGREVPIDDSAAPIRDEQGDVFGAILVFRDVGERRKQEIARAALAAIVQSSHDAIIGQALDGTITSWNRAAEQLYGYTEEEMVGRKKELLLPADRADELGAAFERLRCGLSVAPYESRRRRKDGSLIDVLITASPIVDQHGEVVGAATIGRDITQRKQSEAALQEANRRKDEFLAILAHELRNPLAPLSNSLYIAGLESVDASVRSNALDMMRRQLSQLVRLVDDLLDVSRISQGKLQLRMEHVELHRVIESAVETTRPLFQRAAHALTVRLPEVPMRVKGDETRLAQVFANLLNNAAKYTPPGGRVTVEARIVGGEVVVSVSDSGIGIAPESLSSIFDIFTQVDDSLSRQSGGLGIGLWLVRMLVELHHGEVQASSEGLSRGSTFRVKLPLMEGEAPLPATPQSEFGHAARRRRILVVDDNEDSANSMAVVLRLKGHEVHVAHDGESAVAEAVRLRPDVALLDIGLPKLDGFQAAQRIRAALGPSILLIAVTGWGRPEDRSRGRAAGFDEHLTKPVELAYLDALLHH